MVWIAAVDWAGLGALGSGLAALCGALYAIGKAARAAPAKKTAAAVNAVFQLVDQLQEDNDRLRGHIRSVEQDLWKTQGENQALRQRVSDLESAVRASASRTRSKPTREPRG